MDVLRWCLGKDAPLAVTAMGGKYAERDNREIPDTLEVLWDFGGTMVTFSQINCNAAPGNMKSSEMELRGTKGTMYIDMNHWEVVPELNSALDVPARTPLDRVYEKSWAATRKPAMEPRRAASRPIATHSPAISPRRPHCWEMWRSKPAPIWNGTPAPSASLTTQPRTSICFISTGRHIGSAEARFGAARIRPFSSRVPGPSRGPADGKKSGRPDPCPDGGEKERRAGRPPL
jgi:hypothetical protein